MLRRAFLVFAGLACAYTAFRSSSEGGEVAPTPDASSDASETRADATNEAGAPIDDGRPHIVFVTSGTFTGRGDDDKCVEAAKSSGLAAADACSRPGSRTLIRERRLV
jgi:hypothetical protein